MHVTFWIYLHITILKFSFKFEKQNTICTTLHMYYSAKMLSNMPLVPSSQVDKLSYFRLLVHFGSHESRVDRSKYVLTSFKSPLGPLHSYFSLVVLVTFLGIVILMTNWDLRYISMLGSSTIVIYILDQKKVHT